MIKNYIKFLKLFVNNLRNLVRSIKNKTELIKIFKHDSQHELKKPLIKLYSKRFLIKILVLIYFCRYMKLLKFVTVKNNSY